MPGHVGLTAPEMVEAAERGDLDVLFVDGSNLLEVMPDPPRVEAALGRVPLRVHQDIVADVADVRRRRRRDPAAGGDALRAGGRRHEHDDRAPDRVQPAGRRAPSARPAASGGSSPTWRRGCGPTSPPASTGTTTAACGPRSAELVPMYAGIEDLEQVGDAVQYGGRHLCVDGRFPTPSGRGQFSVARRGADRARARRVVRVDAPRQAVQLDGAGGDRPAHRRRPRRRLHRRARRRRARRRRRRPAHAAQRGRSLRRAGQARAPAGADPAGALAGGQRRCSPAAPPTASRRAGCPTTTPSSPSRSAHERRPSDRRANRVGRPAGGSPSRSTRRACCCSSSSAGGRTTRATACWSVLNVAAPFVIGLAVGWALSPNVRRAPRRGAGRRRRVGGDRRDRGAAALVRVGSQHGVRVRRRGDAVPRRSSCSGGVCVVSGTSRPRGAVRSERPPMEAER